MSDLMWAFVIWAGVVMCIMPGLTGSPFEDDDIAIASTFLWPLTVLLLLVVFSYQGCARLWAKSKRKGDV